MRNKGKVFCFVLFVLSVLVFTNVNGLYLNEGKRALDGTTMFMTYEDPTLMSVDPYTKEILYTTEVILDERRLLKYNLVHVGFRFGVSIPDNLSFTIEYYNVTLVYNNNTDVVEEILVLADNATYTIENINFWYVEKIVELNYNVEETRVKVRYKDVYYSFLHKTDKAFLVTFISNLDMNTKVLLGLVIAFVIAVLAISLAGRLVQRSGNFDLDTGLMFSIIMMLFVFFIFGVTFIVYVSPKIILFYVPMSVLYVILFLLVFMVSLNKFNKDRKCIMFDKFDTKTVENDPIFLPTCPMGKEYRPEGLKDSLARHDKMKDNPDTLRFGHFIDHFELVESITDKVDMKDKKYKKKFEPFQEKYKDKEKYSVEVEKDDETLTMKAYDISRVLEDGLEPKWEIAFNYNKASMHKVDSGYKIKEYKIIPSKFEMKWVVWGIGFGVPLLLVVIQEIFWKVPAGSLLVFVKAFIWVLPFYMAFKITSKGCSIARFEVEISPQEPEIVLEEAMKGLQIDVDIKISSKYLNRIYVLAMENENLRGKILDLLTKMSQETDAKSDIKTKKYLLMLRDLEIKKTIDAIEQKAEGYEKYIDSIETVEEVVKN